MYCNPFVSTHDLSDDALLEKINTLAEKINNAKRAYMNQNLINQMEQVYHYLNDEYAIRLSQKIQKIKPTEDTDIEIGGIESKRE